MATVEIAIEADYPEIDRRARSFVQAVVNIFATLGLFAYTFRLEKNAD